MAIDKEEETLILVNIAFEVSRSLKVIENS